MVGTQHDRVWDGLETRDPAKRGTRRRGRPPGPRFHLITIGVLALGVVGLLLTAAPPVVEAHTPADVRMALADVKRSHAERRAELEAQREQVLEALARKRAEQKLRRDARAFRQLRVSGDAVDASVDRLLESLDWHLELPAALASARHHRKPLVWIHALGELDGFL